MKSRYYLLVVTPILLALGAVLIESWTSLVRPTAAGPFRILVAKGVVESLAWSPDGKLLAAGVAAPAAREGDCTGRTHRQVLLWDAQANDYRRTKEGHAARITYLAFLPHG